MKTLILTADDPRPDRTWLWEGLIPEGDHVSISAPVGTGKSLLVLALAVEAARCICGMEPEIAAVLLRMAADELEDRVRGRRA